MSIFLIVVTERNKEVHKNCSWKTWREETTWNNLSVDGRLQMWDCWVDPAGSEYEPEVGTCDHVNEPLGFIKDV
jgi:hypothetical protein